MVAPCSKLGFADWWAATAADRLTKLPTRVLDHRRFWDAMAAITLDELAEIERRLVPLIIQAFGLYTSAEALDMTNFATYIDSANTRVDAQRARPSRSAPICGWSGWGWWSPTTVECRCCRMPTRATNRT